MFDWTTQSQSFQSRRKLILENINDIDSAEEIFINKNYFLWTNVSRRNKYKSIFVHENIIKIMKLYFIV
jgi:SET domain-containing protein